MALPASGTITLAMIATEFGGSAPHSLSEYYRGGGLVPNTGANASVPTSGVIRLSNFYGASAITAPITVNADWGSVTDSAAYQTSPVRTLTVPSGNPGSVTISPSAASGALEYSLNGGGFTIFTVNTNLTGLSTGATLGFRFSGGPGDFGYVSVTDTSTGAAIGAFSGLHL